MVIALQWLPYRWLSFIPEFQHQIRAAESTISNEDTVSEASTSYIACEGSSKIKVRVADRVNVCVESTRQYGFLY